MLVMWNCTCQSNTEILAVTAHHSLFFIFSLYFCQMDILGHCIVSPFFFSFKVLHHRYRIFNTPCQVKNCSGSKNKFRDLCLLFYLVELHFAVNTIPILKVEHWGLSYFFEKYSFIFQNIYISFLVHIIQVKLVQWCFGAHWLSITWTKIVKTLPKYLLLYSAEEIHIGLKWHTSLSLSLSFFFFNFSNLTIQRSYIFCTLSTQRGHKEVHANVVFLLKWSWYVVLKH